MPDARVRAIAAVLALTAAAAASPLRDDDPRSVLLQDVGLTEREAASLDRGETVVRIPGKRDGRDVAVIGAIRVAVSPEFFLERFRDITAFKKNRRVLEIGTFGRPARLDDLHGLTFDRDDLDALPSCRVGDCDVRLGASDIARLRTDLDWSAADRRRATDGWLRDRIIDYVTAYQSQGNAALITYADEKQPVSLAEETATLLHHSSPLLGRTPEFVDYLTRFPAATLQPVDEFFYWSKEALGLKPVVSVTHVVMYTTGPDVRRSMTLVASKQIYASHYFDASLGLTLLAPSCVDDACAIYLAYVNRSRTDLPGGPFAGFARSILQGRTKDGMRDTLSEMRQRLEDDFRQSTRRLEGSTGAVALKLALDAVVLAARDHPPNAPCSSTPTRRRVPSARSHPTQCRGSSSRDCDR